MSNKFKINNNDKELIAKFKSIITDDLSERIRFGIYCNILIKEPKISVFACLLDPRHQNLNHENTENVKTTFSPDCQISYSKHFET